MNVIGTNDAGIKSAAIEIVRSHTPDEIARIVETANPLVARAIQALLVRHGAHRAQPEPRKRQAWPGRPGYQRERL